MEPNENENDPVESVEDYLADLERREHIAQEKEDVYFEKCRVALQEGLFAQIPYAYREARLPEHDPAILWAEHVIQHWKEQEPVPMSPFMYLWGKSRRGKTHTAWATLRFMFERNFLLGEFKGGDRRGNRLAQKPLVAMHIVKFLDALREEMNTPDKALRRLAQDTWMLFLDDLGVEKRSEWTDEVLDTLIDARSNNHMPTIITSNFALIDKKTDHGYSQGAVDKWGERIVARLVEKSFIVHMVGQPWLEGNVGQG